MKRLLLAALVGLLGVPATAFAQADRATVSGVVKDSAGAVLPGATVTVTNTATDVAQEQVTSATGTYLVVNLIPGQYRIDISLTGGRIKRPLQCDIEVLSFGPRPVPGEIEAFLNKGIDVDSSVLTRAFTRVQQHILDDGVRPLAVLHHLVEVAM